MNRKPFLTEPGAFLDRARDTLLAEPEPRRAAGDPVLGDHRIAGYNPDPERIAGAHPAAVLAAVVLRPGGHGLILTERSSNLRKHSGQVAFPGGRIDPGESPLDAALREAEEEIGLAPELVTPLGYLPSYYTGTGYQMTPVVGIVHPDAVLTPNPAEVARVFEVSLAEMFDMTRYRLESRFWDGRERQYYVIDYPDAYIWGATAAVIRVLFERLNS